MKSFSLILPTLNAYKELDLCLESLDLNSKLKNELIIILDVDRNKNVDKKIVDVLNRRKIKFFRNKKNLGPYGSWNKGAKIAKKEILCFITDDQYFAPGWDKAIMEYMRKDFIISSQLVEPGVLLPSFSTILRDFGENAVNFKNKEFLEFAEKIRKNSLIEGIFFIPLAIYKKDFFKLGMFSTGGEFGIKGVPNDVLFIRKAKSRGLKFKSSLASISYHFQASSWERWKKLKKWKNKLKIFLKGIL